MQNRITNEENLYTRVDTRRHGLLEADLVSAEDTTGNVMDPQQEEGTITRI